jgi:ribosomal subunit interface protein
MKTQFTFKHMPSSQALADLATEKLEAKIQKFTSRPVHNHVTFSVDGLLQKVHVSLITADGYNIEAEHAGEDMYAELDVIAEKVETQLRRHKERLKHHNGESIRDAFKKGAVTVASNENADESFDDFDDVGPDAIDAGDILNADRKRERVLSPICQNP